MEVLLEINYQLTDNFLEGNFAYIYRVKVNAEWYLVCRHFILMDFTRSTNGGKATFTKVFGTRIGNYRCGFKPLF